MTLMQFTLVNPKMTVFLAIILAVFVFSIASAVLSTVEILFRGYPPDDGFWTNKKSEEDKDV